MAGLRPMIQHQIRVRFRPSTVRMRPVANSRKASSWCRQSPAAGTRPGRARRAAGRPGGCGPGHVGRNRQAVRNWPNIAGGCEPALGLRRLQGVRRWHDRRPSNVRALSAVLAARIDRLQDDEDIQVSWWASRRWYSSSSPAPCWRSRASSFFLCNPNRPPGSKPSGSRALEPGLTRNGRANPGAQSVS